MSDHCSKPQKRRHRGGHMKRCKAPLRASSSHDLSFSINPTTPAFESECLEKFLLERRCLPANEEYEQHKEDTLKILETILCKWSSTIQDGLGTSKWQRLRVTVVTFGSYRLRVHRPESDMDILAIGPPECSREEFFSSLVKTLEADARVTNVHAIPSAFTPVIRLCLNEVPIDMLYARLSSSDRLMEFQKQSPPLFVTQASTASADEATRREYMIEDEDFVGVDEASVRSLNGARVSQKIKDMLEENMDSFRVTLCAVKEWAIIHGLYSNVLGFLGGINFAILVAWICKRHPEKQPSTLLRIFFQTFSIWEWPLPINLTPVQREPPPGIIGNVPIWDPHVNPRDALHLMPILTPTYPTMNSAYNVGISQLRRLQEEIMNASRTLEQGEECWREIFQDSDFFFRHNNFLQITITANEQTEFVIWKRFCESRLRLLFTALETPQVMVWPFAKFFDREPEVPKPGSSLVEQCTKYESYFFVALRFAPGVDRVDLRYLISDFAYKLNTWERRVDGMDLGICHLSHCELPSFVFRQESAKKTQFAATTDPRSLSGKGRKNREAEDETSTRLTPNLAKSTMVDENSGLQSPLKKAKNE